MNTYKRLILGVSVVLSFPVLVLAQTITIDNGIPRGTLGHWSVVVMSGGESRLAFVTAERAASRDIFTENVLFDYFSYVDVGDPGGAFRLTGSAPVADISDPNKVSSSGSFTGTNGNTINWTVTSSVGLGSLIMTNRFVFSTVDGSPLGRIRFLQYMDEDVEGVGDDIFFTRGALASRNLELFAVDNREAYGVSQSGAYDAISGLVNATFAGWAADVFDNMRPRITGAGQPVSREGVINNLPTFVHPLLGTVRGPRDVVSVLAWDIDAQANRAVIVTTLGGAPTFTVAEAAAEIAKTVVGGPYLWGGKGWDLIQQMFIESNEITQIGYNYYNPDQRQRDFDKGLDCSGLIFWAYNKSVDATTYQDRRNPVYYEGADGQFNFNSEPISETDLRPGDLLFFNFQPGSPQIDHVAMYVGGNGSSDIVHASSPNVGIKEDSKDALKQLSAFAGFRRITTPRIELQVRTSSPVNLIVRDPDGLTITAETLIITERERLREIPGVLYYSESDVDGDGTFEDTVTAPVRKLGNYFVSVVPEAGALPSDTYSLEVEAARTTIVLAQNVPIKDIPSEGYGLRSTEEGVNQFIPARLDVRPGSFPNSINPTSRGVIPVAIITTHTFDATTLDPMSVRFGPNGAMEAHGRGHIEDVNRDGKLDLVLHFNTQETGIVCGATSVSFTGETFNGQAVSGFDSIRTVGCK